jgi:hypothetical protein
MTKGTVMDDLNSGPRVWPGLSKLAKWSIRAAIVFIWLAQSLRPPVPLDADGIAYLDIARSCFVGNWHALVNGYWSLGLPVLLALCLKVFRPGRFHDLLLVNLVAFFSLCAAMLSFEYFLRAFGEYRRGVAGAVNASEREPLPQDAIWLIGFGLFFWITTLMVRPALEQPDILVFVVYLIASALCMELASHCQLWRYVLLGFVLGVGYLVKAVMFPLGFVFLFALLLQNFRRHHLGRIVLAGMAFLAVSLPFCIALSASKGRPTFGDSGAVNYQHIMGMDDTALPPVALPRPALTPHIQEYLGKLSLGTYPPWADPSHDFKGGHFRFNVKKQLNRTHVVLREYFNIYVEQLGVLLCGILVLVVAGDWRVFHKRFLSCKVLWIPALAGLGFYATMRVDSRFLPGFTVALASACLAAIRFYNRNDALRLGRTVSGIVFVLLFLQAGIQAGHVMSGTYSNVRPDYQVATALQKMGIPEGQKVSYMGYTLADSSWAYLAGVRISAEIPREDVSNFWAGTHEQQEEVLSWLRWADAKALVTRDVPEPAMWMGWRRVGNTQYWILSLRQLQSNP